MYAYLYTPTTCIIIDHVFKIHLKNKNTKPLYFIEMGQNSHKYISYATLKECLSQFPVENIFLEDPHVPANDDV